MTRDTAKGLAALGQVIFVVAAAVLVYSFVIVTREGELRRRCTASCLLRPTYMASNRLAPNFRLKDMKGQEVSLESFRGKVVVLNFWTKTCGPCLEEMPEIADLAKILQAKSDAVLLTVSVDDGPDDVRPTLKTVLHEDPPFPVLFDPDSKVVREKFGTRLFPETWIIDKRGVIRARFDGARLWTHAAVLEFIDQLRDNGFCPLDMKAGTISGDAAKLCEDVGG